MTFTYDKGGRRLSMQDGVGTTTWAYDALNRVTLVTDPFDSEVGYGYSGRGERLALTYPDSRVVTYTYDSLYRPIAVDAGPEWDEGEGVTEYEYGAAGQVITTTLPSGIISLHTYDEAHRLTALSHTRTISPTLTLGGYVYELDAMGQRVAVTETLYLPDLVWQYLPLVLHQEAEEEESLLGGGEGQESETLELPTEAALEEGYPGPEEELLEAAPSETVTPTGTVTPTATPTATPTPDETPTPLPSETPTPDAAEELSETPEAFGSGRLARPAFDLAAVPAQQTGPEVTTVITYAYDSLYRVLEANYSTGVYFHYTYDEVGNRLTEETLSSTTNYEYDASNRLIDVEGVAYTWDDNGNLLDDGTRTYAYDAANRLVLTTNGVITDTHAYNGFGDRLLQTTAGAPITYTLDLNLGLTQVLSDGTNTYLYGLNRIGEQQPEDFFYHLPDGLGSLRQLADADAEVQLARSYQPYGSVLRTEGFAATAYGFTGEATDGASGLVYLRARHYAPGQGRFLTRDDWPGDMQRPQSLNAWLYAQANPINLIDPTGHAPCAGNRYDDGPHCVQHPESRWHYDNERYQRECRAGMHGCDEIFAYAEVGAAVLFEPLDWALTVRDLAGGDCSPLVVLGLLPIIPGRAARQLPLPGPFEEMLLRHVPDKLTETARDSLRREARTAFAGANPGLRARLGHLRIQVHHRIPLEWAHLFPKADPNRRSNLIGLPRSVHLQINSMWARFRSSYEHLGRAPTTREVLEYAAQIDRQFSQHYR